MSKNGNGTASVAKNRVAEMTQETTKTKEAKILIPRPNYQIAEFTVRGNAPYVQNAFSAKIEAQIREKQAEGSTAKGKKKRDKKDFDALYQESMHKAKTDGKVWYGIPAGGIRSSLVSACRTVEFAMTKAKLAIRVLEDGTDMNDGRTPLVRITKGEPEHFEAPVRLPSGAPDIRVRAAWAPGWEAVVRLKFDADMLRLEDVANLLMRAGNQVGWGEGRPDSKASVGMGWGTFDILDK